MKRLVLWGMGQRACRFFSQNYFELCQIVGVIDTYREDSEFMGIPVYRPESLPELMRAADYLLVATQKTWEVYEKCILLGVDLKRVIFSDHINLPVFYDNMAIVKKISPKLFIDMQRIQYALIKLNERDSFDADRLIGTEEFCDGEYRNDYFRYRTFEFIAEELIAAKVKGAVAELGVFRGMFSKLINKKFSDKKMYLFDTFEGFDVAESEKELSLGRCDEFFIEGHKETTVDLALRNLLLPDQCIVCKGLFPQSITKEAEKEAYCFVSIDVDFEDSIYAGIEFFYPRLVDGGVLYIHDYNTCNLQGVKSAVKRYEKNQEIILKKIPIADRAGTLIVIK